MNKSMQRGAIALLGLLLCATPVLSQNVSPHGFRIEYFGVWYDGGGPNRQPHFMVYFSLRNVSDQPIKLQHPGIFVGARWNSTTDQNNRDFGHSGTRQVVQPGERIPPDGQGVFMARLDNPEPGTWRFWPAYRVHNQWGPFRWQEKVIEVPTTPPTPTNSPPYPRRPQ